VAVSPEISSSWMTMLSPRVLLALATHMRSSSK
jgi:hypothetical protein